MKRATKLSETNGRSLDLASAQRELLDQRLRLATLVGTSAYALNTIEPWVDFHDIVAVKIQLTAAGIMACMGLLLFFTKWGKRHGFAVFTFGYFVAVSGFEATVCYERAFDTVYSAGFPVFYAFYCVLIPTTVLRTALIGVGIWFVTATPQVWITGDFWRLGAEAVSDATAFGVLLASRYIANNSWQREFKAKLLQSDFISAVSHDFSNPLQSLSLWTEQLAAGKVTTEADRSECYQRLLKDVHRLVRLVDGLLRFGRNEANIIKYDFDNIDPSELVPQVARDFEHELEPANHRIVVRISDDAPLMRADADAFRCVLWNLLDNAVKYSPGCEAVWADVGREGQYAMVRVSDRGFGIPESDLPHIFKKFVRGEAAPITAIPGTGLGLALAHNIVTAHGGTITVQSKVGQGSTFTVLLPAVK